MCTIGLAVALAAGVVAPVPALAQAKGKAPSRARSQPGQARSQPGPARSSGQSQAPTRSQGSSAGTNQQASLEYQPKAGYNPPPRSPGRLAPAQGALMGVHSADSASLPPDQQGVVKLEQAIGRTMDINNHYHGAFDDFAKHGMSKLEQWDVQAGRIPLVGWGCTPSDRIANGSLDGVIHATAQKMRAFGHEFFLRYCWEMDGDRRQGEIKGPQKFIAAWQRMYGIFKAEHADNVIWVWTPNAAGFKDGRKYTGGNAPAPYFYPGDNYVDWIASDGYNWGVSKRDQGDRWRQVLEIFDEFMVFARAHHKPIMIGEYGAQEQTQDPAAKPRWMRIAHDTFMNKPRTASCPWCGAFSDVAAVVYFDVNYGPHGDWRIMSSQASMDAYKEAALDPYFHQLQTISWAPAANRNSASGASSASGPAESPGPSSPPDSSNPPDSSGADPSGASGPPEASGPSGP